jgi:hypothetical protein
MEIDPRKSEDLKTLDKSIDLGDIYVETCNNTTNDVFGKSNCDNSEIHLAKKRKIKKKNRCPVDGCNKKLGLLDLSCKCEKKFCIKHRHPEEHSCDYDFKSKGREKLKMDNKIVSGIKVEKI